MDAEPPRRRFYQHNRRRRGRSPRGSRLGRNSRLLCLRGALRAGGLSPSNKDCATPTAAVPSAATAQSTPQLHPAPG
jgi:hypothetical protein